MTGRITQVIRSRACAFIRTDDGREVFFHASELQGAKFDELETKLVVRFTLIPDTVSGPRAAGVRIERLAPTGVVAALRSTVRARPRRALSSRRG